MLLAGIFVGWVTKVDKIVLIGAGIVVFDGLERVALTCSQYCTVSLQFFAEKRRHIF